MKKNTAPLGAVVAALYDETKKITSSKTEQTLIVYVALQDLLSQRKPANEQIPAHAPRT